MASVPSRVKGKLGQRAMVASDALVNARAFPPVRRIAQLQCFGPPSGVVFTVGGSRQGAFVRKAPCWLAKGIDGMSGYQFFGALQAPTPTRNWLPTLSIHPHDGGGRRWGGIHAALTPIPAFPRRGGRG
jgi:hypothetical protein